MECSWSWLRILIWKRRIIPSGEFAMINTFMVPRQKFRHPELAPWAVLDRYAAGEAAWPPGVPAGI